MLRLVIVNSETAFQEGSTDVRYDIVVQLHTFRGHGVFKGKSMLLRSLVGVHPDFTRVH